MLQEQKDWARLFYERMQRKLSQTAPMIRGGSPYTTKNGVYDNTEFIGEWYSGFWGGLLWRMYLETNDEAYLTYAREMEANLDKGFANLRVYGHDVGFVWLPTAVADYRITGDERARERGYQAACALAAQYHHEGKFIQRSYHPAHKYVSIIDTMMNLPLLYWASEMTGDERFRIVAEGHAETTMRGLIRSDGSVRHEVRYEPPTWEVAEVHAGQGYAEESSWTRGQAWALTGFALSYLHTGRKDFLDTAKQVAHYFLANMQQYSVPPIDFRQPAEPAYLDTTAGAIAACGLLEIAQQVSPEESRLYEEGAVRLLQGLEEYCDFGQQEQSVLQMGSEAYNMKIHIPIIYGDYYLMEALAIICNADAKRFW